MIAHIQPNEALTVHVSDKNQTMYALQCEIEKCNKRLLISKFPLGSTDTLRVFKLTIKSKDKEDHIYIKCGHPDIYDNIGKKRKITSLSAGDVVDVEIILQTNHSYIFPHAKEIRRL